MNDKIKKAYIKKAYICKTDWHFELENASGGVKFYSSVEDLKKYKKCWKDCGILEVEIKIKSLK